MFVWDVFSASWPIKMNIKLKQNDKTNCITIFMVYEKMYLPILVFLPSRFQLSEDTGCLSLRMTVQHHEILTPTVWEHSLRRDKINCSKACRP